MPLEVEKNQCTLDSYDKINLKSLFGYNAQPEKANVEFVTT